MRSASARLDEIRGGVGLGQMALVPPRFLRLVHGGIGRRKDLDVRERAEQPNADARRDRNPAAGQHCRFAAQRPHEARRDYLRLPGVDLWQDQPELVTTQACQNVRLTDAALKRRSNPLEQVVAHFVAEPVVDGLE